MLKEIVIQKRLFTTLLAFNPWTYTLNHTPLWYKWGGGVNLTPPQSF